MRESNIENYLIQQVEAVGGERRKMEWIGRAHAPDQFLSLPTTGAILAELKRPGAAPRPGQAREHERLRRAGTRVVILSTIDQVDQFMERCKGMSDDDLIDRLQAGESMFEKAILAYIMRLKAEKRELAKIVAQQEAKKNGN